MAGEQAVAEAVAASPLIPQWTEEDFYTDAVYAWLWDRKGENPYRFQILLGKAQKRARELKVNGFMKTWNEYAKMNMADRPVVLGANMTMFPEQPAQLESRDYVCGAEGVCYTGRQGERIEVIAHPLMPIKRIINIDTFEEKVQLAYWRSVKDGWKTLIVGKETVSSAQKIIAISKNGIAVNSENAKEVVRYLSNIENWNYEAMPLQKSTSHLGWLPDGQFVPYAEGIEYDGNSPENQKMFSSFREKGDRSVWMGVAKAARSGPSVPCRLALAGAFAAPLVSKFNALPFIMHFYGESGKGKSVGLMLSASVWADPTVGGSYIQTFQATKVAQEKIASFCCNVPMYLDELQMIADRKLFDDIIYMLCEGSSKSRGTKDGGLQTKQEWSNCILTTGEFPIIKSNSGGGAAARTIEIEYGGVPFFPDSRAVAETLKQHYGFAGREYIDAIRTDENMERLREYQKQAYEELSSHDIHPKQILSASLLLAADWMSDDVVFGDGMRLTVEDVLPYLVTNLQADANARCYSWLNGYIAANPRRFELEDNTGELWGVRSDGVIYIIRSVFDRILNDNGYSPTTFLNWARLHGKIRCEYNGQGSGNNRLTKRKQINGHPATCVALVPDDSPEGSAEVSGDDLPF